MAEETFAVDTVIYTLLNADPTLTALIAGRIYSETIPADGGYPCILFAHYRGRDTNAVGGGRRVLSRFEYVIRAITKGSDSYQQASAIASRMDDLLVTINQSVTVNGNTYFLGGMERVHSLRSQEEEDGERYNYLGGIYETFVS